MKRCPFLPSSALASSLALAEAELVIVSQNPATHPAVHPPSKVSQSIDTAILRKQKLLVAISRPEKHF